MPETQAATTNQGIYLWRFLRSRLADKRFQAETSIILGPYLLVWMVKWWGRSPFWGPEPSFFESILLCVVFVLAGRLWDIQHKADETEENTKGLAEKLEELQQALDLKLGAVQGSLGDRVLQIKGISLDITEQLSAVERKIDAITRRA